MSLSQLAYIAFLIATSWFLSHTLLIPAPISDIPYNSLARYMPWGDMVSLGIYFFRTGRVFDWLSLQTLHQKSALIQLFLPSFSTTRPTLVLTDLKEIRDIVKRRTNEIDRADLMHTWFGLLAPRATIGLKTGDAAFKEQRHLWNVVLGPKFLGDVVAECFVEAANELGDLWERKAKVAGPGKAFEALEDIKMATLDGMWETLVGSKLGLLSASIGRLHESRPIKSETFDTVVFERAKMPEFYGILCMLLMCLDWVMLGFSSRLYTWVFTYSGVLGRTVKRKDRILDACIAASRGRVSFKIVGRTCALDEVLYKSLRQTSKSKAEGNAVSDAALRDELLELLITGHETTASSIAWALKYLTDNEQIQQRLRESLHEALGPTLRSVWPSAPDFATISLPYLEAVGAEILRLSNIGPVSFRQTMMPCEILGHQIPTDTPIILVTAGPSYNSPEIRSTQHSWTSPASYSLDTFSPERWLLDGKFDANAVDMLPFSAGSRGCFGKRIALLELKIMIATLILRFEFPRLPERLSVYEAQDGLTSRPQLCYVSPQAGGACVL